MTFQTNLDGVEKMLSVALGELLGNTGAGEPAAVFFASTTTCTSTSSNPKASRKSTRTFSATTFKLEYWIA